MAVEHATELASIVADYLSKHGFAKTLSAFFREKGDAFQEAAVVDLETLYKLYISTQDNGASKVKEPKRTRYDGEPIILEGDKVVRNDGEIASVSLHMNGGNSSEKKKKKKGDEKNSSVDLPESDHQTGKSATEAKKTTKEKGSKKKKWGEDIEGKDTEIEDLKLDSKKSFSNGDAARGDSTSNKNNVENHEDGGCRAIQQELAHSHKKKKKKEKKEQEGVVLQDNETFVPNETRPADKAQVLSQDGDMPKKKRKKSKDLASKESSDNGAVVNSASKVPLSEHTEELDASKQSIEALKQSIESLEGGETSAKRRKHRKEVAEVGSKEPSEPKLEQSKTDDADNTKRSGKKRKVKEEADAGKNSNQSATNLGGSPEKLKAVEGIADEDVEMHELGSAKTKKKQETPSNNKTPTGALAFKRVEVEKVSFSDPRLSDNSYWAKDGADEGYGAKAQEVLGLVRGRDFRHEKTKKKRGSYRGGIIGLESHSIKFENSDED